MVSWVKDGKSDKFYIFVEEIGRGSFGKCFLAVDDSKDNYYACKISYKKYFVEEIQLHSELNHKNIVEFFIGFQFENLNCLVMALCDFGTVKDLLKCRKVLTDPEVRCITNKIDQGLIYLHDKLIIHRDLKLANLLISADLEIKINDFGLSTKLDCIGENRKTICGTSGYMAPEIRNKKGYDFSVDIWALGCIVFTLLDGKEPKLIKHATQNTVKLPALATTKLSQGSWKFLKTIFVPTSKRPSAKTVCQHPYFLTSVTSDKLELTIFFKRPNNQIAKSYNIQSRALQDRTNVYQTKALGVKHQGLIKGKENPTDLKGTMVPKLHLRPRKRLTFVLPPLQKAVSDRGAAIAKPFLDSLLYLLELEAADWKMKKTQVNLVCVMRWVAGLTSFGYNTSDGGLGVYLNNSIHFYALESGQEHLLYEGDATYIEEEYLTQCVKHVNNCLEKLAASGPTCSYKKPILVLAKKFFKSNTGSDPTAVFLLSNGTCQINFANHEKLLINCIEDILVWWNVTDVYSSSLTDICHRGVPLELKKKIEFMCYFLVHTARVASLPFS